MNWVAASMFCALYFVVPAFAAIDKDEHKHELLTLESAENIKFASQLVAKAYFYKQQGVRLDHAAKDLKKSLALLQKDLMIIQDGLKSGAKDEKNIVVFLEYTLEELQDIISKPYSREHGALILDYSDSMLEGADIIAGKHMHEGNAEEEVLLTSEHMLFLMERINKFYIAYQAGFRDYNIIVQLKQAVQSFEEALAKVNAYTHYSEQALEARNKINEFWPVAREFFVDIERAALPVIVLTSVEKLEKELRVLEEFHYKLVTSEK
jgi:hypothetical protein